MATYTSGKLTSVAFPDGRSETFTYDLSGRLATITENGVGSGSRTWTYTWTGNDLTRIDRPLGPAWEFTYGDTNFPGYMTRMELVDGSGNRRVEGAWEYDTSGNVIHSWKGDTSFTGTNAVEKWSLSFDNPLLPATTTATDPLGNTSTYLFARDTNSTKPKLTSLSGDCPVCGSANLQKAYTDSSNPLRVTSLTDGRGITTIYAYDSNGQMTSRAEAYGTALARTTTWQYSSSFPAFSTSKDLPSTSGSGYRNITLSYNGTGDLTSHTDNGIEGSSAFSYSTSATYNSAGQLLTIDPPGYSTSDQTTFTYDSTRGYLVPLTRTDPVIGTTSFTYDAFNRRTQVTDPNSVSVVTAYDDLNRVTSRTEQGATTAADQVTTYEYDNFGDLLRTTLPLGNVLEYGYDTAGRLISIEKKPDSSTHGERTLYTLNGAGNRTQIDLQHWNGSSWTTDSTTQYVFSTRCHPDKIVNADSTVTEYAYDCDGNVAKLWDANHPSAGQTNPATYVYGYDSLNRMTSITQPWGGTGGGNAVTSYTYDVQDHLASVTDAEGNPTTYTTSDRDLVTRRVSNVTGTTTYAYNEHGQRVQETDARSVTVSSTYDAMDRLTFIDYPNNDDLDTTFTYDDAGVAFSKGRLTEIDRGAYSIGYAYDRFGRVTQDGNLTYTYDKNSNALTIGYPNSVTATYTYDFADRQSTLTMQDGASSPQTLVSSSSYKPFGPLASLALGNGLTETHAYSTRYLPSSITVGSLLSWSYTTDSLGNPTAISDTLNSSNNRTYSYQANQYFLTTGNGPWGSRSWTYDKIGNRLTETRGTATDTYSYLTNGTGGHMPQIDQITPSAGSAVSYSYDAVGEVLDNGLATISYDDDQRMSGNGIRLDTAYFYDGRGFLSETSHRFMTGVGGAAFPTYSSDGLLMHRQSHRDGIYPPLTPDTDSDLYVFYFAGRPVATLENVTAGATYTSTLGFLSTDHLGTPILMTDTGGSQVWQGGFEPFGKDYSSAPTPLRFPGQWTDPTWSDAGLYYNLSRWYGPLTGQYTSVDPFSGSRDERQLAYAYASNDPLLLIDPSGLLAIHCESCKEIHDFLDRMKNVLNNLRTGGSPTNRGQKLIRLAGTGCDALGGYTEFTPGKFPFAKNPCIHTCIGAHERVHRQQCRQLGPQRYNALSDKDSETPAYEVVVKCLQAAEANHSLELTLNGVSY